MIPVEGLPLVAAYAGNFGAAQAERLLWRAGFGPRKGEAEALGALGLEGAVQLLTHPGAERLRGPAPKGEKGRPVGPFDRGGHGPRWLADRKGGAAPPVGQRIAL